jgi:benzoylformate decarboxylase
VSGAGLVPLAAKTLLGMERQTQGAAGAAAREEVGVRLLEGTAGLIVVEQLRAAGIKYLFHTNTSGVEAITDGVLKTPGTHIVMLTHEAQGIAAAQGYAMASGVIGFFIGSSDGVDNAASNLHNALEDRTPLIACFDGTSLASVEKYSMWSQVCTDAETMPEALRKAIRVAAGPPGGPVTMTLPGNLTRQKIRGAVHAIDDPVRTRPSSRAGADVIERLARAIVDAQSPLFVVGRDVSRGGAVGKIQALAEKLGVPVYQGSRSEYLSCDFSTDHPLFLGSYMASIRFPEHVDLFVNFGTTSRTRAPKGVQAFHFSSDETQLASESATYVPVLADVPTAIVDLSDALDGLATADRLRRIRTARGEKVTAFGNRLRRAQDVALKGRFDQRPLSWERVGFELERALWRDAVIVPELGAQAPKLQTHMKFGPDHKLLLGRTAGGQLGWGVAAAFGVQLGVPDSQVVCLQGDGGFLFGQTETMWAIARYEAPLLIVVMNNRGYNETRNRNLRTGEAQFQAGRDLTGYFGNPDVDFTKIASGYGIAGEKVNDPDGLAPTLGRAVRQVAEGRPFLVEIDVRRDGLLSDSTWYPRLSIAELGGRKQSA